MIRRWKLPPIKYYVSWFFIWNIFLQSLLPFEVLARRTPVPLKEEWHPIVRHKKKPQLYSSGSGGFGHHQSHIPRIYPSFHHPEKSHYYYYSSMRDTVDDHPDNPHHPLLVGGSRRRQGKCNGKDNLIQDLGTLAIFTGAVGTMMGIYSASYYSVVGNVISLISSYISWATGIPSAILTYLAASDRISYTAGNVLSFLSLANTAYGMWSVDFGNKDILTSQTANIIGVFSLILSIITAFPDVFDAMLYELTKNSPRQNRREIYRFVRNYGCIGDNPTFYEVTRRILGLIAST